VLFRSFPLIPYLQFDLGEVAIIMAFFMFGPLPAVVSSFVEFVALLFFGQQIPVGPLLKLFALLSTVGGMTVGSMLAFRMRNLSVRRVVSASVLAGAAARAAVMTIPNYYLIVFLYSLPGIEGFLKGPFSLIGISLTDSNALTLILGFTALFNVLQLAFVIALSYTVLLFPPVSNLKVGGRAPWFVSTTNGRARAGEAGR
jgi:riboflavin transporter FmnP